MFPQKPVKVDTVVIHIVHGKAFIPSLATYPSIVVHSTPVYVTELDLDEMISAIETARASGWIELPEPESRKEIIKKTAEVLLGATKTRSWKELARAGSAYMITWLNDGIRLSISQPDKRGRYEYPKSKQLFFSVDTPLKQILRVVLADAQEQTEKKE